MTLLGAVLALLALMGAAMLGGIGKRLSDWLFPTRFNYRLAAFLAGASERLAYTEAARNEARDALGLTLAELAQDEIADGVRPLATVLPVVGRSVWTAVSANRELLLLASMFACALSLMLGAPTRLVIPLDVIIATRYFKKNFRPWWRSRRAEARMPQG